jgi:ligand-binding SRPBCC domain-containing protein
MQFSMSSQIPASIEDVFAFCTCRAGFEQQFPYPVTWLEASHPWQTGSLIRFKFQLLNLGLLKIWLPYHAEIVEMVSNRYFVDVMRVGPYQYFRHRHDFELIEGMTHYTDKIEFSLGYGHFIDRQIGLPILRKIFRKRHQNLKASMQAQLPITNPEKSSTFCP